MKTSLAVTTVLLGSTHGFSPVALPRNVKTNSHVRVSMAASDNESLRSKAAAFSAALAIGLTPLAASAATPVNVPYSNLLGEIKSGEVERLVFASDEKSVLVTTSEGVQQVSSVLPSVQEKLIDLLVSADVPFTVQPLPEPSALDAIFSTVARLAFPLFLLFLFLAPRLGGGAAGPMGGMGGGMFDIGKSKSKIEMEPDTGVTFADVAGCEGSKLELVEIVDFLKKPEKFAAVGAKAPRGVIMEGPPGTGKTLLAKAVAGEAGVPFISASGSEFVEMFVGVGASRIRDLFGQAKKSAPCIIFIDEIDAIGKSRSGGAGGTNGGGNDEREQTLNQILTEMDGFEGSTGVVVVAATNRADVLDAALLRPGRFDRRVPVDLPDKTGRFEILKVHARSKPLDASVDLEKVAARTTGFSGASLANLLNEAAIVAARRERTDISISEVEFALDRLTVGMEKRTGMANIKRQELVAYHEAGHAIMGAVTPGFDAVGKVTIIPRSNGAGGFTLFVPSEELQDSGMYSRRYLEAQLAVALGGRIAEQLVYGDSDITTGASGDFQRVAQVARMMVTQWGFAIDELGATAWEGPNGNGMGQPRMASASTEKKIDEQVEIIVRRAYDRCFKCLSDNRNLLEEMKNTLILEETIDYLGVMKLIKEYGVNIDESILEIPPALQDMADAMGIDASDIEAVTA
uniref:AAA+ ATPase domain-containing protein n=1 Tax=Octactis speculum TaxID=3111310 RepID=A0A7S2CQ69_9STRA|mmetsp:Transcript_38563/g.52265  ORF Transcript_38563/g.52265 Transcript_38563/m.52265 type:complete len:687 (+) Transcript_38563:55-2115(+)